VARADVVDRDPGGARKSGAQDLAGLGKEASLALDQRRTTWRLEMKMPGAQSDSLPRPIRGRVG